MSNSTDKNKQLNECISILATQHFDVLWRKTLAYYRKTQKAVIDKVLDIIDKHSEFRFALQQANVLRHYVAANPENAERLKKAVRNGQIEIVGGLETIPDSNIPSGESLVRNMLYGRLWVKEYFGVEPKVATMLDAFGSSGQLPQILAKMGYDAFFAGRLPGAEFTGSNPTSLFVWEGIDGSEIAGLHCAYASIPDNNIGAWYGWGILEGFDEEYANSDLPSDVFINDIVSGLDNISQVCQKKNLVAILSGEEHLPRHELVEALQEYNAKADLKARLCRFDEYVDAADWTVADRLSGEYNVEFTGCYTTRIDLKQLNQTAEVMLYNAEYLKSSLILNGSSLECIGNEKDSWQNLFVGQFHDSICGCHIDENYHHIVRAYVDAISNEKYEIENICKNLADSRCVSAAYQNSLVGSVTASASAEVSSASGFADEASSLENDQNKLLLVNTHPFGVKEAYKIDSCINGFVDDHGDLLPAQRDGESVVVVSDIEAGCAAAYEPALHDVPQADSLKEIPSDGIKVGQFDVSQNSGRIVVKDIVNDIEVFNDLQSNSRLVLKEEKGTLWTEEYTDLSWVEFAGDSKLESIELGPVFLKISFIGRVTNDQVCWAEFEKLEWRKTYYIYHELGRVEFSLDINFEGKGTEVALEFDCDIDSEKAKARYEIPFGSLEREPYEDGKYALGRGNWPALTWLNYEDETKGLTFVHTGTPGCLAKDGTVSFSLLRSATDYNQPLFPAKPEELSFCNGIHNYRFAIIPHSSNDESWLQKARSFVYRPVSEMCNALDGCEQFGTRIKIDKENVCLSSLKPAEDGRGVVLRVYEVMGRETDFSLSIADSEFEVFETSMDEQSDCCKINSKRISLMPYEIKTFRVSVG